MWQTVGILLGGYAFIFLSYAWVWMIGACMSRSMSAERIERFNNKDVKVVLGVMGVWTVAYAIIVTFEMFI